MKTSSPALKVGLLAYADTDQARRFLIHQPLARRNLQDQPSMPFGLIRGSIQTLAGEDIRSLEALQALPANALENPLATLHREMVEEAGLQPDDLAQLIDHGVIDYHSERRPPYPIHFFSARIDGTQLLHYRSRARDCHTLALKPYEELAAMAMDTPARFKPAYLNVINILIKQLPPFRTK